MRAMVLHHPRHPLQLLDVAIPEPTEKGQVLIQVEACGICRTDLHIYDGELPHPKLPLIPGHQVIGTIAAKGPDADRFPIGTRIGIPWLGRSCGQCPYCLANQENLCDHASYTGYTINGGFAEYCLADENFIFPIPSSYSSIHAAPLLCAGLIGFRSLRLAGANVKRLGFYGFGAAAHILIQITQHQNQEVFAFTRKGDKEAKRFAGSLGAVWTGDSDEMPPQQLDAALVFASAGELIPLALQAVKKGGSVVCAGIHMSDIPSFPYSILYGERILRSVTNLTREDGQLFFTLLHHLNIETKVTPYPLEKANEAIDDLKRGKISGSAVLLV
jgi:alcohol dehydrogenase, propanol-preferring